MEFGLSLGSNVGDRLAQLTAARFRIAALADVTVVAASRVYETRPVGVAPEYEHLFFLNAILLIDAHRTTTELLAALQAVESDMGRKRTRHNAPRTIDIDIIYAGTEEIREAGLVVPHPRWATRAFVVFPLSELRPDLRLPPCPQTLAELVLALPNRDNVIIFADCW